MTSEAVRCEGLTRRFGKVLALDRLDMSVQEGSVFGFLGPNGSGKTTTIKLLTGLITPSAGQAWVAEQRVSSTSISLRQTIGYLPEEPPFYNWMTGREFLLHIGALFGLPAGERGRRTEELLELVELASASGRRIGGYSRGMRQRLGIAQAVFNRPRVLFLDEPCSALDPIGRKEVLHLMAALRGQATVFFSTHILSDVERVCDTVAILNKGRLVAQGPVEKLRQRLAGVVFEMEFEEDAQGLADRLRSLPWVTRVERVHNSAKDVPMLRLWAKDVDAAKKQLPALLGASGLTLLRYELTTPSLEETFIKLVEEPR